jgi:hypothetical protein
MTARVEMNSSGLNRVAPLARTLCRKMLESSVARQIFAMPRKPASYEVEDAYG